MKSALNYLVVLGMCVSFSSAASAKVGPSKKDSNAQKSVSGPSTIVKSKNQKTSSSKVVGKTQSQKSKNKKSKMVAKAQKAAPQHRHIQKMVYTKKVIKVGKSQGKKNISTDTFNNMIDATDDRAYDISAAVSRGVASVPEVSGEFQGSTVVAGESNRNPVKYNPLLEEDRVEVKLKRLEMED